MSQEERLEAALQAALGYFAAAGCIVENGRVTAPPAGTALSYEATFYGKEDTAQLLAMQMASEALSEIGVELTITNIPLEQLMETQEEQPGIEERTFYDAARGGPDCWDWISIYYEWQEWYLVADPDAWLYPNYSSTAEVGWYTRYQDPNALMNIVDPELDQLLLDARSTVDLAEREAVYEQCLERIWDWACEVPYFQSHDELLYNSARVDPASFPENMTGYYGWLQEIHHMEFLVAE